MGFNNDQFFIEHFYDAIDKGYIQAFFQPIYRSVTGKMICAESLARWIDPEKGILSPVDFIPLLEQNNLIYDLDMEILRQACEFYQILHKRGTPINSFSVNLSRQDFMYENLYDRVISTLASYNVPHEAINLEITESLMMEEVEVFKNTLQKFDDAGFKMWMDDFGSGYSSLNVLKNYHFDLMKFDMLFLRDFSLKGRQLLASLINMAKSLGIHTLTEGVEVKEHQKFLVAAGCEAQQGFYFAKPLSRDGLIKLIDKDNMDLEREDDSDYWRQIGQLNFLSARPLEEFSGLEPYENIVDDKSKGLGIPLALVECSKDSIKHVYASNTYISRIKELGYSSLDEVEDAYNNQRSEQYLMFRKIVSDAVVYGTIQKMEYANNDVFFRLGAKCLARKKDRAMIAFYLSTFDSEKEKKTAENMMNYGNYLFSTYELVVLLYPDSGIPNRIYSSNSLPEYDRAGSLDKSARTFCQREVDPRDQERYMKFLDFSTIFQKVDESEKGFVQNMFRMLGSEENKPWHIVRLSRVHGTNERAYLLTMQLLPDNGAKCVDYIVNEHPELLGMKV